MNSNSSMAGLASLVQSRGRNGDSMLVHMTPGEVKGLHALALAHGGSLTINPDTGLVEANFLKKLLPTLLGVGLSFIPGVGPLMAAGLVGAGETIRTGDLGKGLMAGLGAFGGAGLGAGLSAAAGAAGTAGAAGSAGALTAEQIAQKAITDATTFGYSSTVPAAQAAMATAAPAAAPGFFSTVGQGFGALGSEAGRSAFMSAIPGGTAGIAAGGMGLANALSPEMKMPKGSAYNIDDSYYEDNEYDPMTGTFRGGQWRKGYPGLPPPGMAGGGVIPAPNDNYPLVRPSNSVGGYGPDIDPYTGEERFAAGGAASGRRYEEMPADRQSLEPNSAKAGWMEYMRNNPEAQKAYLNAGYPAEFFQQDPNTFTGNRPFIPGIDESTRQSEQERLMKAGYAPSYFEQFKATNASAGPTAAYGSSQQQTQQPQSLEAYYQSLLAPPVQQGGGGQDFANYMQGLNKFVTSPVAAPTPPAQQPPPAGVAPPGAGGRPVAGGSYSGDGRMRWDSTQGRFVTDAPQGRPGGADPFSGIGNIDLSNFGNIDFSALREYMGGMGEARGGNTSGPRDRNIYDQFTGDMDDMGDMGDYMGSRGGPQTTPMGGGMYGPTTGNQRIEMGDMGDVAYAGGTPGFDMTGGMGGMGYSGMDFGGDMGYSGMGGGMSEPRELAPDPTPYSPRIIEEEPALPAPPSQPKTPVNPYGPLLTEERKNQPMSGEMDFKSLAAQLGYGQQADTGGRIVPGGGGINYNEPVSPRPREPAPYVPLDALTDLSIPGNISPALAPPTPFSEPEPREYIPTPFSEPERNYMPAPYMSQMQGEFGGIGDMQQPAPQPAPSYDMSGFGGFGGMPQQPAPSFDMGGMGGGMDFGGAMDYSGGGFAGGGAIQYAAGGKFLRGPGDGMSDDIKANINGEQEARLADGEFVIPADVVSHIGNGSSEAGADRLYKMMADIRKARTGKTRQAPEINVKKYLPA